MDVIRPRDARKPGLAVAVKAMKIAMTTTFAPQKNVSQVECAITPTSTAMTTMPAQRMTATS